MGIMSNALEKNLHICQQIELKEQTWEHFNRDREGKHVFIFGTGGGMDYFLSNCCNHMEIAGVIDNDKNKQGKKLGWYCAEAVHTGYGDMLIQEPEILDQYSKHNIIVLVTSVKFYYPMVDQLRKMGIDYCYVLLMLEANKWKSVEELKEREQEIDCKYLDWCCEQKIENNKIVMLIGVYGDHARQITRVLLRQRNDLNIVWLVDKADMDKPENVRLVYMRDWKRYAYEMETAKIWLFDDLVSAAIKKREGQLYIQVKHWSSITLKMFYLDDKASKESPEIQNIIRHNGEMMDYLFSGSEFDERSCQSGFMFQGQAIRVGSARSDLLFDKTIREKILTRFAIDKRAKVCLYVPTYRLEELEKTNSMSILLDLEALLTVLRNKWEGEWFLFVRLHPSLVLKNDVLPENPNIINVQNYTYSEELVAAADVIITDYSSIMFEGAYGKKPVFLYAPDRAKFIDGERGLLIDYDTLPFPRSESDDELHQCIRAFEKQEYEESITEFLHRYGVNEDGHASERAAKFIGDLLKGELKNEKE